MADGLHALRTRRRRVPPPSRHPVDPATASAVAEPASDERAEVAASPALAMPVADLVAEPASPVTDTAAAPEPPSPAPKEAAPRPTSARRTPRESRTPVLETVPDEPQANLAIRVRRSLDFRLSDLVHELRRDGVKTSKVELVEMLLSELPPHVTDDVRLRLRTFRGRAPRSEA